MKFLHAADLHIDSQLLGLDSIGHAPAERIRGATRDALRLLVDIALRESVDFAVLAGDIFDGRWPDATTGAWTASEIRRLSEAGIAVYLLRGNHDARSQVASTAPWPTNVYEFAAEHPETFRIDELQVALHGQGFARREAPHDLTINYPQPVDDYFNVGVLHTSLAGDPQHDPYAPTSESVLSAKGYDYWALGHIHKRRIVRRENPTIVFPGNTQGRHINEAGERGCYVVEVDQQRVVELTFHPTDVVRWQTCIVEAQEHDDCDDVREKLEAALLQIQEDSGDRLAAVRVTIQGHCAAHRAWQDLGERDEWEQEIRHLEVCRNDVWIEKLQFKTAPVIDQQALRKGDHLLGELLRMIDDVRDDENALKQLASSLHPLTGKGEKRLRQAEVDWESPEQLRNWLEQAEASLISQLWESADQ